MKPETQPIVSELENTFELLRGCCGAPDALEYFIDLTKRYFILSETAKRKEVLILGSSFPEEILWANRLFPHWVIGGGRAAGEAVDSRVPRDADSVSRSVFGYIENYLKDTDMKTPIIVPITGDNQRKLAYLLKEEGRNVSTIDIPSEMEESKFYHFLTDQISSLMSSLTFAWNLPGEAGKLRRFMRKVSDSKKTILDIFTALGSDVSGMLKLFLLNTYFYAGDIPEWTGNLKKLADELKSQSVGNQKTNKRPGVLIIGSPVLFPNYKVPILLENAGLSILGSCGSISGKLLSGESNLPKGRRDALLYHFVQHTYSNDCSGAFVSNHALYHQASHLLSTLDVQGVIFHIIKGQIEYDFELERMEALFAEHKLPVFRLETDYHDNDVEQLRIRLEAFAELLIQDRKR